MLAVDARCERIAERSVELLSDETRQTLQQLLARRRPAAGPGEGPGAGPGTPVEATEKPAESGTSTAT